MTAPLLLPFKPDLQRGHQWEIRLGTKQIRLVPIGNVTELDDGNVEV
ncbi:MAG: hypothetical protein VKM92_00775 [Cyanobacteriota bacterium]|nr:hypothetical protein [Cyanobacteriota bacterium]